MLASRCMLPWLHSAPYPLYVPLSPCARSAKCKPCPMALVPDSTVHCSRPQPRSIVERPRSGPMGKVYTYQVYNYPSFLDTAQACLKKGLGRFAPSALPHYKHNLPRLARSTLIDLLQNQHEKPSLVCVCVQSPSGLAFVPCALSMVDLCGHLRC